MDDAAGMGVMECLGQPAADTEDLAPVQGRLGAGLRQRASLQVLHRDEERAGVGVATGVVDHHDPGMGETPGDTRLGEETLLEGGALLRRDREREMDDLERDRAAQGGIERLVDDPHHAAADLAADLVAADRRGRGFAGE